MLPSAMAMLDFAMDRLWVRALLGMVAMMEVGHVDMRHVDGSPCMSLVGHNDRVCFGGGWHRIDGRFSVREARAIWDRGAGDTPSATH